MLKTIWMWIYFPIREDSFILIQDFSPWSTGSTGKNDMVKGYYGLYLDVPQSFMCSEVGLLESGWMQVV